jgi:hypothetical protein
LDECIVTWPRALHCRFNDGTGNLVGEQDGEANPHHDEHAAPPELKHEVNHQGGIQRNPEVFFPHPGHHGIEEPITHRVIDEEKKFAIELKNGIQGNGWLLMREGLKACLAVVSGWPGFYFFCYKDHPL